MWTTPPSRLRLPDGAVDVWRIDLAGVDDGAAVALSGEVRARAERFVHAIDRRRWTRSRGVLRALLGRYLDAEPAAIELRLGPHGKPELLPGGAVVQFNVSHSGDLALVAVSGDRAVGVDVERLGGAVDAFAIALRVFGAAEAARLAVLDPAEREAAFLRAWTVHEATLKCLGVGFAGAEHAAELEPTWLAELDVGPIAVAAVAVAGSEASELHTWEWPQRQGRIARA
jgi:4'-phosphopantetheinyl transferase